MLLLGIDIGSSSVKVSVIDGATGQLLGSASSPEIEMSITAEQPGWAEQHPGLWWENLCNASRKLTTFLGAKTADIGAIGISYQMHGLVTLDRQGRVLRSSIIWCDSRAVPYGDAAFEALGEAYCLNHLLNSPGNFTAAKLAWVKKNERSIFEKIHKAMLPGDFIAYRLTDEMTTTLSGLSEGIFVDFQENDISRSVLKTFDFSKSMLPKVLPTFGVSGNLTKSAAYELGLPAGIPVTYRAGDQPNNAFSLNVLEPGEVAATAGTSGVVYGVNDRAVADPKSRVNIFAHVNHHAENPRLGVLLCVNGCGILYSWLRRITGSDSYVALNQLAEKTPIGADNLQILPFGNGAERLLENRDIGASFHGLQLNRHEQGHLVRAAQEGIAFSLYYGLDVMQQMGVQINKIRAGQANLFLSGLFREALSSISGSTIELYNTDGAQGAARAAGLGAGWYKSPKEAFIGLSTLETIEPKKKKSAAYQDAYAKWKGRLEDALSQQS